VVQFSPHAATINVLAFAADRPSKLFSTSYDGTVCAATAHALVGARLPG
jgi:hypothetical protein